MKKWMTLILRWDHISVVITYWKWGIIYHYSCRFGMLSGYIIRWNMRLLGRMWILLLFWYQTVHIAVRRSSQRLRNVCTIDWRGFWCLHCHSSVWLSRLSQWCCIDLVYWCSFVELNVLATLTPLVPASCGAPLHQLWKWYWSHCSGVS